MSRQPTDLECIEARLSEIRDILELERPTIWDQYAQAAVMAAGPRFFASVQDIPGVAYDAAKFADAMMAERKKRFEK